MHEEFDQQFRELKEKYKQSIKEKLALIKRLIEEMKNSPKKETFSAFRIEVHKLAGNTSLYGYPEVSLLCKTMDNELIEKIKQSELSEKWVFEEEFVNNFYKNLVEKFT
jgi:HPt (histidine-containing phosphotransfer) domain-containing protein